MKELKKFWFGLTAQQQLVIAVILIIVIWALWNYLGDKKDVLERRIKNKAEIDVLADQGIKPSYGASQYQSYATDLFNAMDGPGTKMSVITTVFGKMKNDADIIELEKAFGLRLSSYSASWWNDPTDLKDWLRSDISQDTINALNAQLARQSITKRY